MKNLKLPFSKSLIEKIIAEYGSPLYIYDEMAMVENAKRFYDAFSILPGFMNYYAVKACPNPHILEVLRDCGMGMDCSSMGELMLSRAVGVAGEKIMFTSNDTPAEEFIKAKELGAIINFDDISHIPFFMEEVGDLPELACCRYNPGPLKEGNALIGNPEDAKYGMTRDQLLDSYRMLKENGVTRFGLHTMVASNELDPDYFIETAKILFEVVVEIETELGIQFEFVNLGGGIGIPYRPEQDEVDLYYVAKGIKKLYDEIIGERANPLNIVMESGRMVTGPYGYLVTTVHHLKSTYKDYVGTDASMADLMRPGMYGAYHHILVLGKEANEHKYKYDVTGSLCENNDKFAVNRGLPEIGKGDILVICDVGAHGHAMGFNYNAKLRTAELLLKEDSSVKLIREAETFQNYFATLNYPGLHKA